MQADAVAEAMRSVRRADFLPGHARPMAAADRALPIGHGQTNSQPTTVANMLHLLDVQPGMKVLDVGSGSGWSSALLGQLVGEAGRVIGVELVPELAQWGADNVAAYQMPWVVMHTADPKQLGWPDEAPYDRILVSAESFEVPAALVSQLRVDGLMVLPVRGEMLRVRRLPDDSTEVTRHGEYAFVPLR